MHADDHPMPTEHDVQIALQHFLKLHEAPADCAAENLIGWLHHDPRRVQALDEALTLWALAGAVLLDQHKCSLIPKGFQ